MYGQTQLLFEEPRVLNCEEPRLDPRFLQKKTFIDLFFEVDESFFEIKKLLESKVFLISKNGMRLFWDSSWVWVFENKKFKDLPGSVFLIIRRFKNCLGLSLRNQKTAIMRCEQGLGHVINWVKSSIL
jgi:hypothetical protein